jgi:4-amino-4-deoxy-L-arabinose transferase-like glycosyltransferase
LNWPRITVTFVALLAFALVVWALTTNLTTFPAIWFDEGSHLHVPKTLVRFGVYADYSSEGFRFYGPTVGVGPTVMLPLAAAFAVFGAGLLQARVVMVLFLALSIFAYYKLARRLGSRRFAWVATALLLTSESVSIIEYGRQVLGEVPALCFLLLGLLMWHPLFGASLKPNALNPNFLQRVAPMSLWLASLCFGLAAITKQQIFLVLLPTLLIAWGTNLVFFRAQPHRLFLMPAAVTLVCYLLWQVWTVLYLGPSNARENLDLLREATAGAALVFSTNAMLRAFKDLLSERTYAHLLLPTLLYAALIFFTNLRRSSLRGIRSPQTPSPDVDQLKPSANTPIQFWFTLITFIAINLAWYIFASIGWVRYAFPALVLVALFVARFLHDLTDGFVLPWPVLREGQQIRLNPTELPSNWQKPLFHWMVLLWMVTMIVVNGINLGRRIANPPPPDAANIAAYLNANVPLTALIETWEPEMGFLTDHAYHYPPNALLPKAVANKWMDGPAPSATYNFMQPHPPDYVLIGVFSRWVNVYPIEVIEQHYKLVTTIGTYDLYQKLN